MEKDSDRIKGKPLLFALDHYSRGIGAEDDKTNSE